MQVKINDKILSISPFISTTWSRIAAIHMKGSILAITLTDGETINLSGLQSSIIETIFSHHAAYLEKEHLTPPLSKKTEGFNGLLNQIGDEPTIRFALGGGSLEGLGTVIQHNPTQSDAPDLPPDLLQKIGAISKIIAPLDETLIPKAEANCNCFHCQIARVLHPSAAVLPEQEEVKDEELHFQQWSIAQAGDKLFSVTNRLDEQEKYSVYLGTPVGCTCGKAGCEHILAVLKS